MVAEPRAVQQQAHDDLGGQARHHDAQQQQGRAAVDDVGQLPQMPAQGGDLVDGEIDPLGQEFQEGAVGGVGRLGSGRARPLADEAADHRRNTKS